MLFPDRRWKASSRIGMGDDVHFISKPYGIADLAREVRKVLDSED